MSAGVRKAGFGKSLNRGSRLAGPRESLLLPPHLPGLNLLLLCSWQAASLAVGKVIHLQS